MKEFLRPAIEPVAVVSGSKPLEALCKLRNERERDRYGLVLMVVGPSHVKGVEQNG